MRMTHLSLLAAALLAANAYARLPAPSDAAKAEAAEAAAKKAWSAKVAGFQLCQAQNQAVVDHHATMSKAGKSVQPSNAALPQCTDPGVYTPAPVAARPIEAAGAHSPPATATAPPSTTTPGAVANPAPAK